MDVGAVSLRLLFAGIGEGSHRPTKVRFHERPAERFMRIDCCTVGALSHESTHIDVLFKTLRLLPLALLR